VNALALIWLAAALGFALGGAWYLALIALVGAFAWSVLAGEFDS
jgi:hypothetical protein